MTTDLLKGTVTYLFANMERRTLTCAQSEREG